MTRAHHSLPLKFETLDDVVQVVRADGGRLSVPRRLILEALFADPNPVAADDIARRLRLELTSVYRNLEKLEEMGVIRHVHLGHGPGMHALVGRGAREYLVCEACDQVTAVEPARLDRVRAAIRDDFGFEAGFGHFPILGICADCERHDHHGGTMSDDDHEHETPHEHSHGDVEHSHPHVHEKDLEDDHAHGH